MSSGVCLVDASLNPARLGARYATITFVISRRRDGQHTARSVIGEEHYAVVYHRLRVYCYPSVSFPLIGPCRIRARVSHKTQADKHSLSKIIRMLRRIHFHAVGGRMMMLSFPVLANQHSYTASYLVSKSR